MTWRQWLAVGIAIGVALACTAIGVICCMFSSIVTQRTERQRGRLE